MLLHNRLLFENPQPVVAKTKKRLYLRNGFFGRRILQRFSVRVDLTLWGLSGRKDLLRWGFIRFIRIFYPERHLFSTVFGLNLFNFGLRKQKRGKTDELSVAGFKRLFTVINIAEAKIFAIGTS